jgi:hypothetical protein
MVVVNNQINNNKTYMPNAGIFYPHADAELHCGAHRPIAYILGFARSHWMMPLGKCLHPIALADAIVNKFFENTKH